MTLPGKGLIRVALVLALAIAALPGTPQASTAGPVIYHTPVAYAAAGQKIGLTAYALCDQRSINEQCVARVFYRATVSGAPADLLTSADPQWSSLVMNRDPGINVGGATLHSFAVELPAVAADTRGLDYIIKVTDGGATSWSPGTPGAQGAGFSQGMRAGAYHVLVNAPSVIAHVPVFTHKYRTAIPIRADANCAKSCTATLFFRRTGLLQPSATDLDDPPQNPAEGADVQWVAINMPVVGVVQNPTLEQYGAQTFTFQADIPSTYVDTRGVDYAIKVSDGKTRAYFPGTGYNGYGAPTDGQRLLWQHVHVNSPVLAAHRQLAYTSSRNTSIPLTLDVVCWTQSCNASVQYYWFGGPVITATMTRSEVRIVGDATIITYAYSVPAGDVRTPTLSYRFRATDGHTNAYSPGTFYNGAYVKLDGTAAGQYTVAIL